MLEHRPGGFCIVWDYENEAKANSNSNSQTGWTDSTLQFSLVFESSVLKRRISDTIMTLNFLSYTCVSFSISDRKSRVYEILALLSVLRRLYPHLHDLK